MDAVKFIKEKLRMCSKFEECKNCELYCSRNKTGMDCTTYTNEYPKEAVAIVEKWSQEHPQKTMLQDFLEKYPKAKLEENGTPSFCPEDLGYCEEVYCDINSLDCTKCWNRPLEEGEQE